MVGDEPAWVEIIVRGCLESMCEIFEDDAEMWRETDSAEDPMDDSYPHTYEHSLDRARPSVHVHPSDARQPPLAATTCRTRGDRVHRGGHEQVIQ